MGHSSIRIKVRRRKVAHLATNSRKYTVNNNTIPQFENKHRRIVKISDEVCVYDDSWKKMSYPQPKNLDKKEYRDYSLIEKTLFKNLSKDEKMKAFVDHKLEKWIKRNPCPVKTDDSQKDLFESQFLPEWEEKKKTALGNIERLVTAMFNKLPLIGRFEVKPHVYEDHLIAKIKDAHNEGHNVNILDSKKSKLILKAQAITTATWKEHKNMTCAVLKSHGGKTGGVLVPIKKKAA